jgi:hypothetical protein
MIGRPNISRNEWKMAEIGAFRIGNVAPVSRPDEDVQALHAGEDLEEVAVGVRHLRERRLGREERVEVDVAI